MANEIDIKAVVLAGGKGTRLRPFTAVFPKPLVPLGEKPVLEILLRRLQLFGIKNVTLSTGYLAELMTAFVGDGSKFDLNIDYSREENPLGTAGPLGLIDKLTNPTIVMNGDLLTTLNFEKMINFHIAQSADITIAVYQRDLRIDFGVVEQDDNHDFKGFTEKPTYHFNVSMGVNILGQSALRLIEKNKYLDMPDLIMKVHQNNGKVCCYQEDCYWLDIGRLDDYALAQEHFKVNENMFFERS